MCMFCQMAGRNLHEKEDDNKSYKDRLVDELASINERTTKVQRLLELLKDEKVKEFVELIEKS